MPEEVAEREYLPVSDNEEMIVVIEKDKEHTMPSVTMYHKYDPFPAEMHNTTDYFAFIYMKQLVVSMLNDRLSEIVHKGNAPFLNASVSDESFLLSKTKKAFKYSAVCKEDSIDNALSAVVQEVERARRFGFTHS